jgi:DNA-binding transcriptional regulator of glucitol operon
VFRRVRFALTPGWLGLHLLCLALVVTMALLGRWQLDVSDRKHFSLQNFGYALQWWAFSLFTLWMWLRLLRDRSAPGVTSAVGAPEPEAPVTYRRYVMPQQSNEPVDDVQADYNAYLAKLAETDAEPGRS